MSMGDFSVFCSLLWFLSSVVYSFHCRCLSLPLLNLFPGILLLWDYCKWNYFPIFFFSLFILVYRKSTDFCKLVLYPATLLKQLMMSRSFTSSFRYKILQIEIAWLCPVLFEFFLFLLPILLF
jgi:hypothetical protein